MGSKEGKIRIMEEKRFHLGTGRYIVAIPVALDGGGVGVVDGGN